MGEADHSAYEFVKAALECYGLQDADPVYLKEGSAMLFRISHPSQGEFLLRAYAPVRPSTSTSHRPRASALRILHTEPAIRSQAVWLSDLHETGRLPVPELIPTLDGELVGNVSAAEGTGRRLFFLIRWIPGIHKRFHELTREDARSFGYCIAGLHLHAERFSPPDGFIRPRWDWNTLFDASAPYWNYARARLSGEELAAICAAGERIKEDLHAIGESRKEFGMIHRDLQSSNVVFHEDAMYIIDFDHCGLGHYMYDLALPYLHLERLGELCSPMREALMEGYLSRRTFTDDHRAILETFIHMHMMNQLIRIVVKFPDRSSELRQVVSRFARFASVQRDL